MSRVLIVGFKAMEALLLHLGFVALRQKGSHVFYRRPDGRSTTVPNHGNRDLARPLIREILRDMDLSPEQFRKELERADH